MNMNETDYYSISPKNFFLKVEGYINKQAKESSNFRKAAFLICRMLGYKRGEHDFNKVWQLTIDKFEKNDEPIEAPDKEFMRVTLERAKQMSNTRRKKKK